MHITEYGVWADFIYALKFSKPGNYKALRPDCEEISVRRYNELMEDLKDQRKLSAYQTPQVVLERIEPGWLKSVKIFGKSGLLGKLIRK